MTLKNVTVFQAMEGWAPKSLAYDWDNVGLQIGSYNKQVKKIMITLDVLETVVDEAIKKDVDLIIAHHPLFFKSLNQVNLDTPMGIVIQKLIQNDISVYAAHTNLDVAIGGVNDLLCDSLGVRSRENLLDLQSEQLCKIAVYVPLTHENDLRNALSEAGAGHIGNYSHCTFQTNGQGTFKPLEGSNPYIGSAKQLEFVDEIKMETIVKEAELTTVINAMIKAHPYEEAAYDIFPLINKGNSYGIGRIGLLSNAISLQALSEHVKEVFELSHVRVTGDLAKTVQKVAILGGSGEKYIDHAKKMGADVYITGDMTFHMAQNACEKGLSVIDAGHYIEKVMKRATKDMLEEKLSQTKPEIIVSETNTDPFQII